VNARDHQPAPARPLLRVVRGNATAEEIAALVTLLSARATAAAAGADKPAPPRSEWAAHQRRMRHPLHPSPNGWRASASCRWPAMK
jgi:hypothetical protein